VRRMACTLGPRRLRSQLAQWNALYEDAGRERTLTEDGVRVRFRRDPAVERELRELVAVEVGCCTWADWKIDVGPAELVLEIKSAGHGIPVLQGSFLAEEPMRRREIH
jgi:hypothetical protein